MKARPLSDIRKLLASEEFSAWWKQLVDARAARDAARERHDELLSQAMLMEYRAELTQKNAIDTLYRSGDLEDRAGQMTVEAQQLENASLRTVADFEEQRFRASERWYRVCALEKRSEALRDQLAQRDRALAAASGAGRRELDAEAARLRAEAKKLEKPLAQATCDNDREVAAKLKLWGEVEHAWARSAELSLLVAEQRVRSKKVRHTAETLFKQAEERKQRAGRLRLEAEAAAAEREAAEAAAAGVLRQVSEQSDCALGEEFLYFRQRENPRRAWCVPLVEDGQGYNIEVKPLAVYSVELKRGVEFIEPAIETVESEQEGDRRFEEYFLHGRKGRRREEDGLGLVRADGGRQE